MGFALTPKTPRETPTLPRKEAYTLQSLDQVKVLADPLRIRILEAFCRERTTKQVAELLGEKATRLYHHVNALEKVGLIELSRTRQNRGTVEKYYLAVARTFRADSRVFQPKGKRKEESAVVRQMMSTIFDTTSAELTSLFDREEEAMKTIEDEGILSFVEIHASRAELKEVRDRLHAIVESLAAEAGSGAERDDEEQRRYRLTLAYFPLDSPGETPEA